MAKMELDTFKAICADIMCGDTIKTACENNGRNIRDYYEFLSQNEENPDISKLSTRARTNKAHSYFDKCEDVLIDLKNGEIDAQKARVLFDGYLRLAAKANQGLYGNKVELDGGLNIKQALVEFVDGNSSSRDTDEV